MENVTRFVVVGADMGGEQGTLADAMKGHLMAHLIGSSTQARRGAVISIVESSFEALDADVRVDLYAEITPDAVDWVERTMAAEEEARAEHRKLTTSRMSRSERRTAMYLDGNERALGCGGDER